MSEKEKALELVQKAKDYVHGYVGSSMLSNYEYPEQILSQAKKLATMIADEILQEVHYGQKFDWMLERRGGQEFAVYWKEVKNQIQNIAVLNQENTQSGL